MSNRNRALYALPVLLLTLVGCGLDDPQNSNTTNIRELDHTEVELPDGTTIDCLVYADGAAGGLSCDWDTK